MKKEETKRLNKYQTLKMIESFQQQEIIKYERVQGHKRIQGWNREAIDFFTNQEWKL